MKLPPVRLVRRNDTHRLIPSVYSRTEDSVLAVIEREMNGSPGLIYMESVAQANGTGQITLSFQPGTNPDLAQVSGINIRRIIRLTWIIGAGFACVAGTFLALDVQVGEVRRGREDLVVPRAHVVGHRPRITSLVVLRAVEPVLAEVVHADARDVERTDVASGPVRTFTR